MSYSRNQIREIERASIRTFLEENKQYLEGRVLDFGCGLQPYKDLIEGEYVPWDLGQPFPEGEFDSVLMTQVIEYVDSPEMTMWELLWSLKLNGHLVMTFPTNWEEAEETDYWRFTQRGMEKLLKDVGYKILVSTSRGRIAFNDFDWNLGYGIVAQRYNSGNNSV